MDLPTLINFLNVFSTGKGKESKLSRQAGEVAKTIAEVNTSRSTSIKYRAKSLIAQYPVLCSDNLSSKSVVLVNKALEHEYVNLLKLIIQNDGVQDYKNTSSYLKNFHQNIHNDKNLDSTLDIIKHEHLKEANIDLLTPINEDLNQRSLNEDTVLKEHNAILTEADTEKDEKPKDKSDMSAKAKIDNVEIKKANAITPTNVSVDISYNAGGNAIAKNITFGVKCVAHLLESNDIEYYLPNSVITRTPIMRMIQWTTGEIKFFKDFLFAIDELKKTALKSNDKDNFWWRKLQTLSKTSKYTPLFKRKGGNMNHKPIPITTMVISKENVDNIKFKHGIDILQKPSFTRKIIENFFLMTFIVVDESIETVYIFNDDTNDFSAYSFRSLEGFSKQNNIDIKDVYSLLK